MKTLPNRVNLAKAMKDVEVHTFDLMVLTKAGRDAKDYISASPDIRQKVLTALLGERERMKVLMKALEDTGLSDKTRVIYASDHGENLGARGLWGKSNLYRESVDIPLLMAGPGISQGVCETPVSLLDLSVTIVDSLGLDNAEALPGRPGRSLLEIAASPADPERPVFSEYHAVGSDTGAFMFRRGRWKYHHYVRFAPELFDLGSDPEELRNLAADPRQKPLRLNSVKVAEPPRK